MVILISENDETLCYNPYFRRQAPPWQDLDARFADVFAFVCAQWRRHRHLVWNLEYHCCGGGWRAIEDADQMQWRFGSETWPLPPLPGIEQDNQFTILEKRNNCVRLKKVTQAGVTYVYTLKKLV